jgi:hypothetical protein
MAANRKGEPGYENRFHNRPISGGRDLVFGLNGFLNFIPLPPPGGIAGQFMGALYASHYLWVIFPRER